MPRIFPLLPLSPFENMKHRAAVRKARVITASACLAWAGLACTAHAEEAPREPMAVIDALANRIYALGETRAQPEAMIAAENQAAGEVRQYIASGATEGLLAPEPGKQSPLAAAAYMGFPEVVAALLTSDVVRAHIDDKEVSGLTPWMAANLSMKQSLWACNPAVFDIPYRFVPMFVSLPFYTANPTPPYKKVRELLEQAGASADMESAKALWLTYCKKQAEEGKRQVKESSDLQQTVQELGAAVLAAQLVKLEAQESEEKKK